MAVGGGGDGLLREQDDAFAAGVAPPLEVFGGGAVLLRIDQRRDVDRVFVAALLPEELAQRGDVALELGRVLDERHPAVVAAGDAFKRLGAVRAENYRRAGLLHGPRLAAQVLKAHQLSGIRGSALAPERAHRFDTLARALPACAELRAHPFGFFAQPAGADPKEETAAGKEV